MVNRFFLSLSSLLSLSLFVYIDILMAIFNRFSGYCFILWNEMRNGYSMPKCSKSEKNKQLNSIESETTTMKLHTFGPIS